MLVSTGVGLAKLVLLLDNDNFRETIEFERVRFSTELVRVVVGGSTASDILVWLFVRTRRVGGGVADGDKLQ